MKQEFLKFPHKHISYAPRMQSRRMGFVFRHGGAAFKSDGDDDPNATPEQKLMKNISKQLTQELNTRGYLDRTAVDTAVADYLKGVDIEALRSLKVTTDEGKEALRLMAEKLDGLETRNHGRNGDKPLSIREQLKKYFTENKTAFEAFRSGQAKLFGTDKDGNPAITLQTRAAITMTVAASTGSSAFVPNVEVQPGLVDLLRVAPFVETYANESATSSARIVWAEKYNPQGEADFLLEGGVKPLISFEIRTFETYAKKVADKIKVSTEMLEDIDFMAAEIENELLYQVNIKVDEELLNGAGDGSSGATTLKGLIPQVGGYVLTTIQTTTPNFFDVLRAAYAQIISLNQLPPTHVFINPIDGANMDLAKDANGRPLMMDYKTPDGRLFRIQPIETNQVDVGSFLMGDMSRFKVRNYKPFSISYGWVNDDFEKNLVTILGERRLHCFLAANHVGAFIYDQFADVQTAITAA